MSTQEPEEDYAEPKGFWMRMKERVLGTEETDDDFANESVSAEQRRRSSIRLDTARGVRVEVRMNATVFNDARVAADGLKSGHQQIVNLEKATPQMSERILDFLSGVTYALDGTVERIGDKVYLFAPANINIDIDGGSEPHQL